MSQCNAHTKVLYIIFVFEGEKLKELQQFVLINVLKYPNWGLT